jgi:glycosyltransferase involved in cell wall biosynthesis
MKLLIITNIPTPYRIVFFNTLFNALEKSGDKLKVLYCANSEPDRHWDIELNQQEYDYVVLKGVHYYFKNYFIHFNPSVIRETNKFKPDIILYAGSWNMLTLIYNLIYGKCLNKKWKSFFWSEGHEDSVLYNRGIVPKVRNLVMKKFNGFAVPNQRSEDYLFNVLKIKKKPIVMLPNTVDGSFYMKPEVWTEFDSIRVKIKYKLPQNSKLCIQVGQLEDRKSPRELMMFWENISKDIKENYILVLVGEGVLKNELIDYLKIKKISDIYILGSQPKENVRELLFASEIFVLLTKNDPNPLTLIEASFASLPIITTRYAGNCKEIVEEGKNGFVLEKINNVLFVDALTKLKIMSNNGDLGEISRQNAIRNFDINNVSNNLIDQFKFIFFNLNNQAL